MGSAERVVIRTTHARAWGVGVFGAFLVASLLGTVDPVSPGRHSPVVGLLICLALLVLLVRTMRLGIVVTDRRVAVRGYLWTRGVSPESITSVQIVDYLGPWWLNGDKIKAVQLDRKSKRPIRVWGVTGTVPRVATAKRQLLEALAATAQPPDP